MKYSLSPMVWALAWPIMLSNISIPLLGMVDTAVVGHLPNPDNIAAVALGAMVFDILFWCFGFLRMSTTALAAQEQNSTEIYYQSGGIALLIGVLLVIFTPLLKPLVFFFIQTDSRVEAMLGMYFDIRILSAIPTFVNYVNYGFFFGQRNTKIPLILLLLTNFLAMLLDYIFVWQLNLGAKGIALANVATQSIGALLGIGLIYKQYLYHRPRPKWSRLFSMQRVKQLFTLNVDIFIRTFFLVMTTAFFTRQSASLGVEVVAANVILMHMQLLTSYALDGFAIAAESLIGRAVGQRDRGALTQQICACAMWSLLFGLMIFSVYAGFGTVFIYLMTSISSVQMLAYASVAWVVILPLLSVPGFLLDGVFIGAAWSRPLRNAVLFSSLLVFFPVWYFSTPFGNQGLWLAYTSFIVARGLYLALALWYQKKHLLSRW